MIHLVLVEPEIPQNTGNVARTCAVTGSVLHLVGPLGFEISDARLKRAGLDYWSLLDIRLYASLEEYFEKNPSPDLWLATTKAVRRHTDASFRDGCHILLGKETAGLPRRLLERYPDRTLRIPQIPDAHARCLNLSNAAAVMCFEALRQTGFRGMV
ncbi:MAG: tRNA (cytidine(34)-2'-O)-methyltransferase [Clostridia bacterium]|nr:tRNA (cytidine(34)-2'-O)-methyltransferase [Clostridia bacterium]